MCLMCSCEKKYKISKKQVSVSHEKVEMESIMRDTLLDKVNLNRPAIQAQSNEVSDQAKLLKEAGDGLKKNNH